MAALKAGRDRRAAKRAAGKSGAVQRALRRGRPMGAVAGDPRRGARLNLIATLRAAAPWQPVRRRERLHVFGNDPLDASPQSARRSPRHHRQRVSLRVEHETLRGQQRWVVGEQ